MQFSIRIAARQTPVRDAKLRIFPDSAYFLLWGYPHSRKAWLFSDTPAGAHSSAVIYSLLQTARANGVEPYRWLRHVLRELPAARSVEAVEALLPWNVKSALSDSL